jgi:hypothetical protein
VTSGSSGRSLQSQIFYVRTSQRFERPNRGFQLPPCPGVLSASALRAGALALAPTCAGLRTGRAAGFTCLPARALAPSWGGARGVFRPKLIFAESGWQNSCKACRAGRRKTSRSGSRLDEVGQVRRRPQRGRRHAVARGSFLIHATTWPSYLADLTQTTGCQPSAQAGKPFLVCCCPLCFLCLLLSDSTLKLAFINAIYFKKETGKGGAATGSRRTKKARQKQQRQHLR